MASTDAEALATELRAIKKELKDMSQELSSIRRALYGTEGRPGIEPSLAYIARAASRLTGDVGSQG